MSNLSPLSSCMVLVLEEMFCCSMPWKKKHNVSQCPQCVSTFHVSKVWTRKEEVKEIFSQLQNYSAVYRQQLHVSFVPSLVLFSLPSLGCSCPGHFPAVSCRGSLCGLAAPSVSWSPPGTQSSSTQLLLALLLHVAPGLPTRTAWSISNTQRGLCVCCVYS